MLVGSTREMCFKSVYCTI